MINRYRSAAAGSTIAIITGNYRKQRIIGICAGVYTDGITAVAGVNGSENVSSVCITEAVRRLAGEIDCKIG